MTYPSGVIATYGYHPETGWLASLVTKNSDGVELVNLGYTEYDKVGNRKARSESGMTTSYDYDAVHQLTRAATGESAENFAYDPVGNRKSGPTVKETEAAAYDHALDNSMTQGRKYTYTYDDYGNRQYGYLDAGHSKYWTYTWDGENRLTQAELKTNGATVRAVSFKYDPFGRRIEKKVVAGGVTETRTYVYDGEDIVVEYVAKTGATTRTIRYVHGPGIDQPLALLNNGQTYYYHADGLGSIVAITAITQSVMQRYTYDAYGVPKAIIGYSFENSYLFTGREWDKELGLYYYRARYYDPMEGRFISKDPIGFAGGDWNLYRYTGNNPTNYTDPSGLLSFMENFNRRKDLNNQIISSTVKTVTSIAIGSSFNANASRIAGLGVGIGELVRTRGQVANLSRLGSVGNFALTSLMKSALVGAAFWGGQQIGFGIGAYLDTAVDDGNSFLGIAPESLDSVGFGSGYSNPKGCE